MTCKEAAVTAFTTPDDGCCDTRNMQRDFAVNKYLLNVASGWNFINTELRCTEPRVKNVRNPYCSPTTTMGARTRLDVTLYAQSVFVKLLSNYTC